MADQVMATGRRKTSVARVIVKAGNGAFKINGKTIEDYLPTEILRLVARQPLTLTGTTTKYDSKLYTTA